MLMGLNPTIFRGHAYSNMYMSKLILSLEMQPRNLTKLNKTQQATRVPAWVSRTFSWSGPSRGHPCGAPPGLPKGSSLIRARRELKSTVRPWQAPPLACLGRRSSRSALFGEGQFGMVIRRLSRPVTWRNKPHQNKQTMQIKT